MAPKKRSCSATKCRKEDTSAMVSCNTCKRWWHFSCAKFDPSQYDTATPWFCGESSCRAAVEEDEVSAVARLQPEDDIVVSSPSERDELEATLDVLMEAAAVAQAAAAQKDVELAALQRQLDELRSKPENVMQPVAPTVTVPLVDEPSTKRSSFRLSDERLEMIRRIQANHQALMESAEQHRTRENAAHHPQSTPISGARNCRVSLQDSSIQQSDMANLLTILNRSNVQELPIFSGANKREWPYFEEVFRSTTIEGNYSGKENVARLRKALKGEAYQLVSDRLKYSSDDVAIMNSLRAIFGRADVLVHGLTSDLLKLPPLKSKCDANLQLWAVKVNGFVADLKSMKREEDLTNGYVLTDLSCKLGAGLYQEWKKRKDSLPRATLQDFAEFLTARVTDLPPELVRPLEPAVGKKPQGLPKPSHRVLTHQPTSSAPGKVSCGKCGRKQHTLEKCEDFNNLTAEQRLEFVRGKAICFTCLDPSQHNWRACARKRTCGLNGCVGRHHQLLHSSFPKKNAELNVAAEPFEPQPNFNSSHVDAKMPVLFKVVPIRIHGNNDKFVDTYAFLDDGSCLTMFEKELFDDLDLDGIPEELTLQWTKGVSRVEEAIRTNISVSGVGNRKRHLLKGVYVVNSLELPSQTVNVASLKDQYPHLRGLPLTDLCNAKPRILVGLDQAKFLLGHGQRHGKDEEPCALKTLLGWIVYGQSTPTIRASCFHQVAKPAMHFAFHDAIKGEDELHNLVKRHFSTEEFGVMPPKGELVSKDVRRALDIMEQTLKMKEGRYEIGLLWASDGVKLPDSYHMAFNRLIGLERSLKKNPDLLAWMNDYMRGLVSKGYARVATTEDLEKEWARVWYAPTFIVHNPNKLPPKPRVVADVAAKVKGVSLNTYLLKGPDNLVPLHAGLFKFRERKVAVNADVKEMFHQIRIKEDDQQCQRILWRDGDSSKDPTVYIFEVMMFGPRCSPTCSQFVKNHHANLFRDECPEAVDGLTKRTYVDDYFNSHDTTEQAVEVTSDAIRICNSMGFSLVGVQSNNRDFLLRMPESHINPKLVSIDPNESEGFVTKVLGMFWHPSRDHFTYVLSDGGLFNKMFLPDFRVTKREILRTVMRIFDPLGLISHYIIRGRVILQEVWREGLDWDEPVSTDLKGQWLDFVKELMNISHLKIPRRYVSWNPEDARVDLIVFVDASEKAFAAVAYFRFERSGVVEVSLAMAKAKVAPVKKLSVPRLELQAAVLGVRLVVTIRASHTIPIQNVIFLSDSKTVLAWINSTKCKFPSFVATRVGEILDSSSSRQWYYVKTLDNVADDGTRWADPSMGNQGTRWFRGPDFLRSTFVEWPITPGRADETLEAVGDPGIRVLLHERGRGPSFSIYDELHPRFRGRWSSSVRVIALLLRFKDICQKKEVDKEAFVTPREFIRGEQWLFRKIQQEAFQDEVASLRLKKGIAGSSSIYSLSPFMDEEGTIRMSSRAQRALTSYAARNPAILPKNHPLIDIFIQHHHDRNLHVGSASIISDIRERAWIVNIRGAVQRVKSRCNMCKRRNAQPVTPLMGQLPRARLAFDERPFTHVGVDCFGPMLVKFGRGTVKRYGMIFTCLTFRAVQIELLNDLSLDQCTMALRRFVVNRVVTRYLYSDNGLNFIGARNLLEKDVKEMEAALSEHSAKYEGILWRFIPAYSPWMGGAWERLIRSIKVSVEFILRGTIPREDVLRNALIEAQGQINRRPLTHIPVDPEDPLPLTPNSMLFGEAERDVTVPGVFTESDAFSKLYSRRSQHLMKQLISRWYTEYLPEITRRTKWHKVTKPIEVDDVVILIEPNEIRSVWQLGRIIKVVPGPDGVIRTADVRLPNGAIKLRRAVGRLAVLDLSSH